MVYAGAVCVGEISGACFNPAVAIGLVVTKHFWKPHYALWIVLAEMLGAVASASLYFMIDADGTLGDFLPRLCFRPEEEQTLIAH